MCNIWIPPYTTPKWCNEMLTCDNVGVWVMRWRLSNVNNLNGFHTFPDIQQYSCRWRKWSRPWCRQILNWPSQFCNKRHLLVDRSHYTTKVLHTRTLPHKCCHCRDPSIFSYTKCTHARLGQWIQKNWLKWRTNESAL